MTRRDPDLVIIGAGPAGLATAGVARRMGVEPLLIDKAPQVGGAWARMRPQMRCLSPRRFDQMPDGSTPSGSTDRATAAEVLAWLRSYAQRERFDVLGETEVTGLRQLDDRIEVKTTATTVQAGAVVIATGEHGCPHTPALPGQFDGPSCHSSQLAIDDVAKDDHVLVAGVRNSAAEVVALLLDRGVRVTVSARSGLGAAAGVASGLLADLRWRASAVPLRLLPGNGGCTASTPVVDDVLQRAANANQINVVGAVERLSTRSVHCAGDVTVSCDRIVWATGFVRDLAWLPDELTINADGLPTHNEGVSLQWSNLGFVGFPCMRTRRSGFIRGFVGDATALLERLL